MFYRFLIKGETPSKKNSRIISTKTGRSFPSKKYTEWHKGAMVQILQQKVFNNLVSIDAPIKYPVEITLVFTHGDRRRRDADNAVSSIFDLLTDAGILEDDNYNIIVKHTVYNNYARGEPCVLISIDKYEEKTY